MARNRFVYLVVLVSYLPMAQACQQHKNLSGSQDFFSKSDTMVQSFAKLLAKAQDPGNVIGNVPKIDRVQPLLKQYQDAVYYIKTQIPEAANLYSSTAGVVEGYNILTHTLRVASVAANQRQFYPDMTTTIAGKSINLEDMFVYTIAAHDLGKAVAIEKREGTQAQHKYVPQAAEAVLTLLGMSPEEILIGKTLVGDDLVGDAVKFGRGDAQAIVDQAKAVQVPVDVYWGLLRKPFFVADATSYANNVRASFFGVQQGDGSAPVKISPVRYETGPTVDPVDGPLVSLYGTLERFGDSVLQLGNAASAAGDEASAEEAQVEDQDETQDRGTADRGAEAAKR